MMITLEKIADVYINSHRKLFTCFSSKLIISVVEITPSDLNALHEERCHCNNAIKCLSDPIIAHQHMDIYVII